MRTRSAWPVHTLALVLAALLVAGALAACSSGGGPTTTTKPDQGNSIMDKFYQQVRKDFDAIRAGKAEDIYEDDTSASLKADKNAQDFAASFAVEPAYTTWTTFTIEGDKTRTQGRPGTEGAVVAMTIDLAKGNAAPYKVDVQYVFEKGRWRMSSILPSAAQQQN